ncbi:MAG: hypothetical protein N3G19_03225 [Candidatus Pacearchaeota archaeon]|nr:hypothetical protein [Candidatus Pacearchaeota archaeon]
MTEENNLDASLAETVVNSYLDLQNQESENSAENSESSTATTGQAAPQQTNWLDSLQDYRDLFDQYKQQNLDEIAIIKNLLEAQRAYQSNPQAFTLALMQKHMPELFQRLQQVQQQQTQQPKQTQQPQQQQINLDELDEEDKQLYRLLQDMYSRIAKFENYLEQQQKAQQEQVTNYYLNQLQELYAETDEKGNSLYPLLKNAQFTQKLAPIAETMLRQGIETDFKNAIKKAYYILTNQPPVQQPKRAQEVSQSEVMEDDSGLSLRELIERNYRLLRR